jgi:hypothetical protein
MTTQAQSSKRWWILLPILLLAAWLALFGDKTPVRAIPPSVASAQKSSPVSVKVSSEQTSQISLMELVPRKLLIQGSTNSGKTSQDLFTHRSWSPAPRPTAVTPAPPPPLPMAPPVPFTYLGKRLQGQKWQVFLGRADQTYVVSAGSTIENLYRVDAISPPNLSLTYLPLGQSQSISIGEVR